MRQSRFTEEQMIGILKEQESGIPTKEVCRKQGVSTVSIYKWKEAYNKNIDHTYH